MFTTVFTAKVAAHLPVAILQCDTAGQAYPEPREGGRHLTPRIIACKHNAQGYFANDFQL